jgi:hypothetical protein
MKEKVIHSEAFKLNSSVIRTCDKEARKKKSIGIPLSEVIKRAAEYCGESETVIKKISKEHTIRYEQGSAEKLSMPGKKRSMWCENTKLYVDSFDRFIIRNIIIFMLLEK